MNIIYYHFYESYQMNGSEAIMIDYHIIYRIITL